MNFSILLIIFCFFNKIINSNSKLQIINQESYYIIRNSLLKKIIYNDIYRLKSVIKQTKIIYNKLITKYYETNEKYYSLTENERAIIETVISLTY